MYFDFIEEVINNVFVAFIYVGIYLGSFMLNDLC